MRRIARALLAIALATAPVLSASPAVADTSDCTGSDWAVNGRELFDLDPKYIPDALRAFPADCTSRLSDEPFDDGAGISVAYTLVYVDLPFSEYVSIVRSLESAGWVSDIGSPATIDPGTGPTYDTPLTSSALAALPSTPLFVDGRMDLLTNSDTAVLTYTDGVTYDNSTNIDKPSLALTLLLTGPFSGTRLDDPSALSALRPFTLPTGTQAGIIAGGAVVLMLVVGWPSALLNSIVGTRYDGLVRWLQKRFGRRRHAADREATRRDPDVVAGGSRLPGWLMWPGFALAALLGAFVDPDFGVNEMSLRVVITLFVSFVLFNLLTWTIVRAVARRIQPDSHPVLRFRWGTLIIVAAGVLVARLLQLEPGIIFGLVAGVAYATALRAASSAIIVLVGSGIGLVLALVGWAGYTLLLPVVQTSPDSVPLLFLSEFLAGVTVKGVSSLPLALLPLGALDGAKVMRWRRVVWGLAYALGLAAFMLVLLTIPKAWGEIPGDFLRWLLIFGGYALIALILWIVNTVHLTRRPAKESPLGEQPDAITID